MHEFNIDIKLLFYETIRQSSYITFIIAFLIFSILSTIIILSSFIYSQFSFFFEYTSDSGPKTGSVLYETRFL